MIRTVLMAETPEYNTMPLINRLVTDMLAYRTETIFYTKTMDIVSARQREKGIWYDDYDEETLCTIREFKAGRRAAWEAYSAIHRVYKSIFGVSEELVREIDKVAEEYAKIFLEKYGWKEKKDKLGKAKEIIKQYFKFAPSGLFDSRNISGDEMETIYSDDGLTVDICYRHGYFEVFGLSSEEFKNLTKYYSELKNSWDLLLS